MGSSGGWLGWSKHTDVEKLLRETESSERKNEYEGEVNKYLQSLLIDYNNRKIDEIRRHLETIKQALDKNIEGAIELVFGGSLSKRTYVNGLSDIDMLVRVNETSLADASPNEVKAYFAERLRERLPNTEIEVGKLAVTVRFSSTGHEIQLLPALQTKTGTRIADPNGNEWSKVIRPMKFAEKLTDVNQSCNHKVIPIIKLFKGLNESLPNNVRLSGYHIESLAIEAFKDYTGRKVYKDMLQHFCRQAIKMVLSPITDSTGQSVHVDEYLGEPNSLRRRQCSAALERLSNRLNGADARMNIEQWKGMFENE